MKVGDTIAWVDGIILRSGIVESVGVDGWWAWGGSGDRHWVPAWCIRAPSKLDEYCADLARERAKARERIAAMPAPVVPAPAPRRVHVAPEAWVHVPDTRWWLGRSPTGAYLRDDGDSMRDVTRSPDPQTGLDGVRRWRGAGLMHARAVRELDHGARHEVWGGRPDVAMQIVEVVL